MDADKVSPLAEFLGQAIYHFDALKPLIPTYSHLLISALFPIYIGSHASLSKPSSAAKPPKRDDKTDGDDSDDEDEDEESGPVQKMEGLEPSDALMFPLTAGLTLAALYFVIKWLEDPAILNKVLSFYFSQMGIFFAMAFLKDGLLILRSFLFPRRYTQGGKLWKVKQSERRFTAARQDNPFLDTPEARHSPLPGIFGRIPLPNGLTQGLWVCRSIAYQRVKLRIHVRGLVDFNFMIGLLDVISCIVAVAATGYFAFVTKPWWLMNFLGFCFCYGSLQFISPSTHWTGTLILCALFFYDIYFVFFTPLMVTVATNLDVPIKLVFPRPSGPNDPADKVSLAMLGLGDIVVPGMMIGLALRFDLFLYYKRKGEQKARAEGKGETFAKPQYQSATGAWGERFWARPTRPQALEFDPPYYDARSFPKTYFNAGIVGYVIGMIATLGVMQIYKHAQPALLYLVPGVLISLWGTALVRGEIREMWEFSDAEDDEEEEEGTSNEKDKKDGSTEKETKDTRGFFSRLFSGDLKVFIETSDKKEKKSNKKEDGKDSDGKQLTSAEASEGDKDLNLVSISISLPQKKKARGSKDSLQSDASAASSSDEELQHVVLPSPEKRDSEPPAKRRRRSPRKLAA